MGCVSGKTPTAQLSPRLRKEEVHHATEDIKLSSDEERKVEECFDMIAKDPNQAYFGYKEFQEFMGVSLPPRLVQGLFELIVSDKPINGPVNKIQVDLLTFLLGIQRLLKGSLAHQSQVLHKLAGQEQKKTVSRNELQDFVLTMFRVYLALINGSSQYQSWMNQKISEGNPAELADTLILDLPHSGLTAGGSIISIISDEYTDNDIRLWLASNHLIELALNAVLRTCFPIMPLDETVNDTNCLPLCIVSNYEDVKCPLNIVHVAYINSQLSPSLEQMWHLLFSNNLHGNSFSQFVEHILDVGPTIVLVRESGGYTFGGFMSDGWDVKPSYQGDHTCFVFSLTPTMRVYRPTLKNAYFAYLNRKTVTMPNGMAFGGPLTMAAIWIDHDFGRGECRSGGTTYACPQLSKKPIFQIDTLEVWSVSEASLGSMTDLPEHVTGIDERQMAKAMMGWLGYGASSS